MKVMPTEADCNSQLIEHNTLHRVTSWSPYHVPTPAARPTPCKVAFVGFAEFQRLRKDVWVVGVVGFVVVLSNVSVVHDPHVANDTMLFETSLGVRTCKKSVPLLKHPMKARVEHKRQCICKILRLLTLLLVRHSLVRVGRLPPEKMVVGGSWVELKAAASEDRTGGQLNVKTQLPPLREVAQTKFASGHSCDGVRLRPKGMPRRGLLRLRGMLKSYMYFESMLRAQHLITMWAGALFLGRVCFLEYGESLQCASEALKEP